MKGKELQEVTYRLTLTSSEFLELYEADAMFVSQALMEQFEEDNPEVEIKGSKGVLKVNEDDTFTSTLVVSYM